MATWDAPRPEFTRHDVEAILKQADAELRAAEHAPGGYRDDDQVHLEIKRRRDKYAQRLREMEEEQQRRDELDKISNPIELAELVPRDPF